MKCPKCKNKSSQIPLAKNTLEARSSFEKLLPLSRKILCLSCGKIYVSFLGLKIIDYN